jgi:hypothetical protein
VPGADLYPVTLLFCGNAHVRGETSQASEYLVDHRRVFDVGDDLDETGTFATFISLLEGPQLADSSPLSDWKSSLVNNRLLA